MARKSDSGPPSNGHELAKLLNLTIQQCYNLANSGEIPKPDNGVWNLAGCAHAYIKYLQGRSAEEKREYATERTRLIKAQANKTELELRAMQASVIEASVVEAVWGAMTSAARARLLALPYRIAQAAVQSGDFDAIERSAADLIGEVLNEIHEYDPGDYRNAAGLAMEAAAPAERQRVGRPKKKVIE